MRRRLASAALPGLALLLALAGLPAPRPATAQSTRSAAVVWRLAEVEVNPEKKPLDTPVAGITGTASESTLTWRKRAEDRGRVVQDYTFTFAIDKPPAELRPGQPATLRVTGRLAGVWAGLAPGHPEQWLRFGVSGGLRLRPTDGMLISSALPTATVNLTIEAPAGATGTATLDASIVNYCSGCRVRWIYRAERPTVVSPDGAATTGGADTTGTQAVGGRADAVQVFDGSPDLLKTERKLDELSIDELLARAQQPREGAVADGLSQLVLRAEVSGPGQVTCAVEPAADGVCRPLRTGLVAGKHYAFAAYTPPDGFGPGRDGERKVRVRLGVAPATGTAVAMERVLRLARPPVLLVHGTFSSPSAWSSLKGTVERAGFRVFVVDFSSSNGHWLGGPSRFRNNRGVIWERAHRGIEDAVDVIRQQHRLAATQADIVGHSMGGLLPRVWASARYTRDHPAGGFRRPANFRHGDIHRLITLCTPHYGSDIARAAFVLKDVSIDQASVGEWARRNAMVMMADWYLGLQKGAVTDQLPESEALRHIGATRVPAHAIACIARPADIKGNWAYTALYRSLAAAFFQAEGLMLREVLAQGLGREADYRRLWQLMEAVDWRNRSWMRQQTQLADEDLLVTLLRAALFGNTPSDGVVRLESQWGGLGPEHRSTIGGVLHSPAPDVRGVQDRILDLLREGPPAVGRRSAFARDGFPPAGKAPVDWPPGLQPQTVEERLEAMRRSNIVPRHAQAIARVAQARGELILFRPVNGASTPLIERDDATKNMHVKGKSSDWGPHEGYIPADQGVSKLAAKGDPQTVGVYNCEVKTSVEQRIVGIKPLTVERDGTRYEVHRLVAQGAGPVAGAPAPDPLPGYACHPPLPDQLRQPRPEFVERLRRILPPRGLRPLLVLYDPVTQRHLDPDDPAVPVRVTEPTEALHVLADRVTGRYLTADYDLLAVGTKRSPLPLPLQPDPEMGYISEEQKALIRSINDAVRSTGYGGGDVVHHGPENQFAKSPGIDYPVTAFEPDGAIVSIAEGPAGRKDMHLKRYFHRKILDRWHMWPNRRWNWDARGTPHERQYNPVQGWPDEDAPLLLSDTSDDNDGPDGP